MAQSLHVILFVVAGTVAAWSFGAVADEPAQGDRTVALRLADLLRAGRTVVSRNQDRINDPELADKGFTGPVLSREAAALFSEKWGNALDETERAEQDRHLLEALSQAMSEVVDAHQDEIDQPGVGFKGFIPAVFARLSGERFARLSGGDARIVVTAPVELVRNRKALPDAWEREVIETRFLDPAWPAGEPYIEVMEVEGRSAFRMMLPEYYQESCLSCHGGPKGEVDITGYPKEGGKVGDLGAVISITLFQ